MTDSCSPQDQAFHSARTSFSASKDIEMSDASFNEAISSAPITDIPDEKMEQEAIPFPAVSSAPTQPTTKGPTHLPAPASHRQVLFNNCVHGPLEFGVKLVKVTGIAMLSSVPITEFLFLH